MSTLKRRHAALDSIVLKRADDSDEGSNDDLKFEGHAAVFREPTLIGSRQWGFVEWIEPGAFRDVLKDDVRFLFNHDGMPMARTTNGSLTLSEDKAGLFTEATLAPISISRDLAVLVERGDVTQMSFAFYMGEYVAGTIPEKDDEETDENARAAGITKLPKGIEKFRGMPYMAITRMDRLFDVSPVTYPAYEGTDVSKVSAEQDAEVRAFFAEYSRDQGLPVPQGIPVNWKINHRSYNRG
jgi:HK97 family phage prohead protease